MKLAMGFLWTISAVAALAADEKPEPRVTIRLSQRIGVAPVTVRVIATVKDDLQELRCPGWRVDYGDGCASEQQSDCDPFLPADERPRVWTVVPQPHKYRLAGVYDVALRVLGQQDVKDIEGSTLLVVTGPEPIGSPQGVRAK